MSDTKFLLLAIVAIIVFFGILLFQCMPPKERGRLLGNDFEYYAGQLPTDICIINGMPQILTVNTESQGGYALAYINTQGNVVIQQYLPEPLNPRRIRPAGKIYWTGGFCGK